jgi:enamine deaminase RidA (YjgF/YER057c/UK114 family)
LSSSFLSHARDEVKVAGLPKDAEVEMDGVLELP